VFQRLFLTDSISPVCVRLLNTNKKQGTDQMPLRKYRQLEPDLSLAPDGGGVGAQWIDDEINEICGANLAWNRNRHCFTVYVIRGRELRTYLDLSPDKHFPLSSSLIPFITSTIRAANAYRSEDPGKAILDYMSRQKIFKEKGLKSFVDDRFPDFRSYAEWSWKKLNDPHTRSVTMPDMAMAYEKSSP
jgi:hypothetical protein